MSDISRVEELPSTVARKGGPPLWRAMVKAYKEGYGGWLKTNVATEKEAIKLGSSLRYYVKRTRDRLQLEFRRRRIADGTYDIYGRLVASNDSEPTVKE